MLRWSLATSLLLLAAAACGGADDDGTGDPDGGTGTGGAHQLCVDKTNQLRASVGRPPVTRSATLEAYADEGAAYDHTRSPHDHFRDTNGGGISFAENECPHWDLSFGGGTEEGLMSACIDAFWSEGPGGGHYDNMVSNNTMLGCGIYHVGSDYTIIQDYGR